MLGDDELDLAAEAEEDEEYIQYDIATYPSDYTLSGIQELWNARDLVIPEFQREFVWTLKQSSLLIESFLMGLPVPPAFFYIDEVNKSLVIDGQQRIRSVIFFFEGYFGAETGQGKRQVFRLTGLSEKSPYHNLRFADLKDSDQRKLRGSVLRAVNIKQLAPRADNSSVYHIFERLNTGGTALKPQEIRNCVFRGPIVGKLRALNRDENWRKLLGKDVSDRFQRDVELVLRLFSLFEDWEKYEKPMKEYLNKSMRQNTQFVSPKARKFQKLFPKACEAVVKALGAKPFHVRGPLNSSVLDATMCAVLEAHGNLPADFKEQFYKLNADEDFQEKIRVSTTDTVTVRNRIRIAKKYLKL
jgi:Protein of unknown function DUF262